MGWDKYTDALAFVGFVAVFVLFIAIAAERPWALPTFLAAVVFIWWRGKETPTTTDRIVLWIWVVVIAALAWPMLGFQL